MPVVVTDNQLDLIRLFYLLKSYKFQAPNIKYQLPKLKIQNIFIARTLNLSYETTFQKLELILSWATLHFVGWVEPTPGFVGFRCTQPNLHFAGVIAKCETQQQPISEPSPKSFYFD
jgi:hypothetical protein